MNAQSEAIVIGKVDDAASARIQFNYKTNPFNLDNATTETSLDADTKTFAVKIELKQPTTVIMRYRDQNMRLYITPGDTLRVRFAGTKPLETLSFEGPSAAHNVYIQKSCMEFHDWLDESITTNAMYSSNPRDFRTYINSVFAKKKSFLDNYPYFEKDKFSPEFIDYATNDIDYWRVFHLMQYFNKFGLNNQDTARRISDSYFDFTYEIDNNNYKALNNDYYLAYLDLWLKYQREKENDKFGTVTQKMVVDKKNKIVHFATPKFNVKVMEDPYTKTLVGYLSVGEKAEYLNLKTEERETYITQDTMIKDFFYKVVLPSGKEGWVPIFSVNLHDETMEEVTTRTRLCFESSTPLCGFDTYLVGKVLYFSAVKDLMYRLVSASPEEVNVWTKNFQQANIDHPEYNVMLASAAKNILDDKKSGIVRLKIEEYTHVENTEYNKVFQNNFIMNTLTQTPFTDIAEVKTAITPPRPPNGGGEQIYIAPEATNSPVTVQASRSMPEDFKGLAINDDAPSVVFRDINGVTYTKNSLLGKIIYLDFWATFCVPCKMHMPVTQRLARKYQESNPNDVLFLYVSIDDDEEKVRRFVNENPDAPKIGVNALDAKPHFTQMEYRVNNVPNYFIIDKQGKIVVNSAMDLREDIEKTIDGMLTK
jgi:thiol-disulfide isomerase/thioredoxin